VPLVSLTFDSVDSKANQHLSWERDRSHRENSGRPGPFILIALAKEAVEDALAPERFITFNPGENI